MTYQIQKNDRFSTPDGEYAVVSVNHTLGFVEFYCSANNERMTLPFFELGSLIKTEKWRVCSNRKPGAPASLLQATPTQKEIQVTRQQVLSELKKAGDPYTCTTALYASLREAHSKGLCPAIKGALPSLRTVYRWLHSKSRDATSLIPAFASRGNFTPRYRPEVSELLLDLIEQHYAKVGSSVTPRTLTRDLNVRCRELGYIEKTQSISGKFVRTFLRENLSPDADYKRLSYQDARAAKAVATRRLLVPGPLHRVEMDTLHVPLVVRTEFGIAQNLWLMVGVDAATGHPLGWHMMLLSPTVADTLACLERCIYSKRRRFDELGIRKEVMDPVGAPLTLVLDNGSENQGQQIDNLVSIGISVTRAGIYAGHQKPFIERLWRSLKADLETVPGCTRFNGKDGGRTQHALKDNLLTQQEAEQWIVRWLFEVRPNQELKRFATADYDIERDPGVTPADRWKYYENAHFLPDVIPHDDWEAVAYRHEKRTLSLKTGVSVEGFTFRGNNLERLIKQYGSGTKILVYWNPQDYRTVYALDKVTGEKCLLLNDELSDRWESSPAYTFREALERKKNILARKTIDTHGLKWLFATDALLPLSPSKPTKRDLSKAALQAAARERAAQKRAEQTPKAAPSEPSSPDSSFIARDAVPSFPTTPKIPRRKKKDES